MAGILTEPLVVVALLAGASVGLAQLIGGASAALIAIAIWLSLPMLIVIVLSSTAAPVTYVPRSILTAEGVNLGRFFRAGFGLVLAGLVGSMSAIAVQADLTVGVAKTSQIVQFLMIIGPWIVWFGVLFGVWRYSFLLYVAGREGRRDAVRKAVAVLIIWSSLRLWLRGLHTPYFKRWQQFLSEGAVLWIAVVSSLLAVPAYASLINQVITATGA